MRYARTSRGYKTRIKSFALPSAEGRIHFNDLMVELSGIEPLTS